MIGFALMVTGGILMSIGRAGLRGSGLILDPQGARQDLKPWNQAAGGMVEDAISASPQLSRVVERLGSEAQPKREVVKVRCANCRALNEENARFCSSCGATL